MLKKVFITAAVGVSVFGVAAASAATLNIAGDGSFGQGTVQQSAPIAAACNAGAVEVALQLANGTAGSAVDSVTLRQQSISPGCAGSLVQAVLVTTSGTAYSEKVRIPNSFLTPNSSSDISLDLPAGVVGTTVTNTTVTIADEIGGPSNALVAP